MRGSLKALKSIVGAAAAAAFEHVACVQKEKCKSVTVVFFLRTWHGISRTGSNAYRDVGLPCSLWTSLLVMDPDPRQKEPDRTQLRTQGQLQRPQRPTLSDLAASMMTSFRLSRRLPWMRIPCFERGNNSICAVCSPKGPSLSVECDAARNNRCFFFFVEALVNHLVSVFNLGVGTTKASIIRTISACRLCVPVTLLIPLDVLIVCRSSSHGSAIVSFQSAI